jgi:hypothetical protein
VSTQVKEVYGSINPRKLMMARSYIANYVNMIKGAMVNNENLKFYLSSGVNIIKLAVPFRVSVLSLNILDILKETSFGNFKGSSEVS